MRADIPANLTSSSSILVTAKATQRSAFPATIWSNASPQEVAKPSKNAIETTMAARTWKNSMNT